MNSLRTSRLTVASFGLVALASAHCGSGGGPADGAGNPDGANVDAARYPDGAIADASSLPGTWAVTPAGGTVLTIGAIWGGSARDIWAVAGRQLLHYTGSRWSSTDSSYSLAGVTGTATTDVWISAITVPPNGSGQMGVQVFQHWSGSAFADTMPAVTGTLKGMIAFSATDVWAVGVAGAVYHYDGHAWTSMSTGIATGDDLFDVWGPSTDNLYAVGAHTYHWNGSTWTVEAAGGINMEYYNSVWGFSADDVWIVGQYGYIQHRTATAGGVGTWQEIDGAGTMATLYGVWGSAPNDLWVVGDGVILHWNGVAFSNVMGPSPARELHAVWGSAANNVWAGGAGGAMLHYTY